MSISTVAKYCVKLPPSNKSALHPSVCAVTPGTPAADPAAANSAQVRPPPPSAIGFSTSNVSVKELPAQPTNSLKNARPP